MEIDNVIPLSIMMWKSNMYLASIPFLDTTSKVGYNTWKRLPRRVLDGNTSIVMIYSYQKYGSFFILPGKKLSNHRNGGYTILQPRH